jgi:hypothetical protein
MARKNNKLTKTVCRRIKRKKVFMGFYLKGFSVQVSGVRFSAAGGSGGKNRNSKLET